MLVNIKNVKITYLRQLAPYLWFIHLGLIGKLCQGWLSDDLHFDGRIFPVLVFLGPVHLWLEGDCRDFCAASFYFCNLKCLFVLFSLRLKQEGLIISFPLQESVLIRRETNQ